MNTPSTIIKSLILPLVIKFTKVDVNSLSDDFWKQFATDFIYYENDATPIYTSLYKLELQNPEAVFEQLPQVYSSFINELAEEYVLGNQSEITTKLLDSENETFLKEVSFLKTMKAVITKTERNQLKKDLPLAYERLVFELDEETLKQVAKKKSREDLRGKFEQWDRELVSSEGELIETNYSLNPTFEESIEHNQNEKSKSKLISLHWIKYAIAASVLLIAGFLYFYESSNTIKPITQPTEDKIVTTEDIEIEEVILDDITTVSKSLQVLEEVGFGFATTTKGITLKVIDQQVRKKSIEQAIKELRLLLDERISEGSLGDAPLIKSLEAQIFNLQKELKLIAERENRYIFDGKVLTMYDSQPSIKNLVIYYVDVYYLNKGQNFYPLVVSKQPQLYIKATDSNVLKALEKIIFDNE